MFRNNKRSILFIAILVVGLLLSACTTPEQAAAMCGDNGVSSFNPLTGIVKCNEPAADTCNSNCAVTSQEPLAFFAGGHQGWSNGPENVNFVGVMNLTQLERGFSMQASWAKWFNNVNVQFNGYTVPSAFEPCNDGCPQILVVNDTVYFPGRDRNTDAVHFWTVSYIELTNSGLLVCSDDTGNPGDWEGDCAGSSETLTGYPLAEIDEHLPADLSFHWEQLQKVMNQTNTTPEYGSIINLWVNPE